MQKMEDSYQRNVYPPRENSNVSFVAVPGALRTGGAAETKDLKHPEKKVDITGHRGRISVIVPVYNVELYLSRCVDSLLRQTYGELEIILVDDGSTDGSGTICDTYAGQDSRVNVIHQENGGVSAARNAGLAEATGTYVAFVDSDDWLEPTYIEQLAGPLAGQAYDQVVGGMRSTDGTAVLGKWIPALETMSKAEFLERFWEFFASGLMVSSVCGKLYRRDKIEQPFSVEMRCGEDLHFNLSYLKNAGLIALVPTDGYCYFSPPENVPGQTKYKQRNVREFDLYISAVRELLEQVPPERRDQERYEAFVFRSMCGDVKWIARSRSLNEAKKEIACYLNLPDVRLALENKSWRGMRMPFQQVGRLLHGGWIDAVIFCCKLGRG